MSRRSRYRKPPLVSRPPNPIAVAAIEGVLDAIMKPVVDAGMSPTAVSGLRGVFAILLGTAASKKEVTLAVDGREPIVIRKEDAQAVGIRGLADLTRAEVANMLKKKNGEDTMSHKCPKCGFERGDRVQMTSGLTRIGTTKPLVRHGVVEVWPEGRCHIVRWDEDLGANVTGLPNPNVKKETHP